MLLRVALRRMVIGFGHGGTAGRGHADPGQAADEPACRQVLCARVRVAAAIRPGLPLPAAS